MRYSFIFCLILLILCLSRLDRLFLKSNDSFCVDFIHSPLKPHPEWEASLLFPEEVFNQPFHYLAKGSQTFVFASKDQKYVLKFYRFPSHMRRLPWRKLSYFFDPARKEIKSYNEKKFALSFSSYQLAASRLSSETGIAYLHLNPTTHLHHHVTLIDKLGYPYQVPLDSSSFILQRKALSFFSIFDQTMQAGHIEQGKQMIDELLSLIVQRCKKQISDLDCMARDNYGWLDGHAIHLDVGRFILDSQVDAKTEVLRITQVFSDSLEKNHPQLKRYFDEKISAL